MKRVLPGVLAAASASLLLSCGGSSSTTTPPSGLKFRAFVSQNVAATTAAAGLIIVNARLDQLAVASTVSAGPSPGVMAEPANHQLTMVFNTSDNEVDVVDNAKETANGKVILPGSSQSLAVTTDATLGFAAVPTAPVAGLSPGEVEVISLGGPALESPVPNCAATPASNCLSGASSIVLSPDNAHLLIFGDVSNAFAVADLTNVGTTSAPNWTVTATTLVTSSPGSLSQLDHPVWATFSPDNSTAYVLSCGAECGGTTSSVTPVTLATKKLGTSTLVPGGATYGIASGTTLYVVGSEKCTGANPTSCGQLSILNTAGTSVQVTKAVTITDGYHGTMAVTSDNQVFVGAQGCTSISSSTLQRGCLSIYNGNSGMVLIGTDQGPVTGIAAVPGRPQVYVIENGELRNWTTTTDTLAPPTHQVDIVGQAIDVKIVD